MMRHSTTTTGQMSLFRADCRLSGCQPPEPTQGSRKRLDRRPALRGATERPFLTQPTAPDPSAFVCPRTWDEVESLRGWLLERALLQVDVPGLLVGKSRPRVTNRGTFMPKKHRDYLAQATTVIAAHWRRPTLDAPVALWVLAWFRRPERLTRRRHRGDPSLIPFAGKPDADNAAGIPMDALTKAGVLTDDTRVVDLHVHRRYVALDDAGGQGREQTQLYLLPWDF